MDQPIIIFLASILFISAVEDLHTQKIPNYLTYPAMLLALAYHLSTGGTSGLIFSVKGLALGMGIFLIPYFMGGMGAGDAKLMGAVGAALGAEGAFMAILYSAIVGGMYALGLMMFRRSQFKGFYRQQFESLKNILLMQRFIPGEGKEKRPKLCYGVAIAIGTVLYMGLEISQLGQII